MTMTETPGSTTCLPRYGTARNPDRPTLGGSVADVARRLGKPLLPWQRHVVDVAFELHPDGSFVYSEIDMTVPRQSGKTVLTQAKTVHRLVKMARTHGPQRSIYTAQRRTDARKKLEQDFAENLRASKTFHEITAFKGRPVKPTDWRLAMNNGAEHIKFGTNSYWQIDAPTSEAGHGDTLDDGTIDEAFALTNDDIEGALEPAMLTRRDAQLWVLSTAGDENSPYLYRKVLAGRAAIEAATPSSVAYFEWSAEDDADPGDPATWRGCSPALGFTISEERLAALWAKAQRGGPESIDTFCRAYLNQWKHIPNLDADTVWVIPEASWNASIDDHADLVGRPCFALSVADDRSWSAFGVAAATATGETYLEVADYLPGTSSVVTRAKALGAHDGGLAIAKGSPAASLIGELEAAGVKVTEVTPEDHARSCGQLFDGITATGDHGIPAPTVVHRDQPHLTVSVRGAEKRAHGESWLWSQRRSAVDISPLVAVTLALGELRRVRDSAPGKTGFVMILGGQ